MEFFQSLLHNVMERSQILTGSENYCTYKHEWSKKKTTSVRAAKKKVQFEVKPLLQRDDEKERIDDKFGDGARANWDKPGVRVKIVMTKEEAERMLSKCKNGGVLEFGDVARELVRVPSDRVRVMSK